jgi:hypothetical protein
MAADRVIEAAGRSAARAPWTRHFARAGFASKALVYAVVAALAIGAALGWVGTPTDTRGAIVRIGEGLAGRGVVLALAAGFLGLGAWFVIEAAWNPRPRPDGIVGAVSRVGQAGGGVGYIALSAWAARYALASASAEPSDALVEDATASFLATSYGAVAVYVAALVLAIVGLRQIHVGATRAFERWLDLDRMRPVLRRWGGRLGSIGFCTQGLLFTSIAASLATAAILQRSGKASGFDGVLRAIAGLPYGRVLLGLVGVGLLAYAAFALIEGAYKRMSPPAKHDSRS